MRAVYRERKFKVYFSLKVEKLDAPHIMTYTY